MSLLLIALFVATDPPALYPQPDLLVEAAVLKSDASRQGVLVLDARPAEKHADGHIPGAVSVSAGQWAKDFGLTPDPAKWQKMLGACGIDLATRVIVYGGDDVRDAARVWWILRYWGVADVRLLNGGWTAWQAAGGAVSKDASHVEPALPKLAPKVDRLATKAGVLKALAAVDKPQIVDARSDAEFCGEMQSAKRNGAIPGAVNLEWKDLLDPQTKRFKGPTELAALMKERGIDVNKPAVTYCQSGGRAAVLAFGLELMGGKQVANYYGSWSEWGNADDTPVEKPKKK
jgi:thiosulfate/3-mercaptopyruvate sulfurtransferase